jgi:uncharacterized protein YegL
MNNKTEIVLIVDRSGSMSTIKGDMEGGFKTFINEQKKQPGEATITYYQFDDQFEKVFEAKNIKDVDGITIDPRGMTALVDASCRAIDQVGTRLSNTPETDRPSNVMVVMITDGAENASKEFTADQLKEKIKHQTDKYNWKFIFLGANIDAVKVGSHYGISAANTMSFAANSRGVSASVDTLTRATSLYRSGVDYSVSDEDRKAAMGNN